jgi:predicted nucleotidyltransferase
MTRWPSGVAKRYNPDMKVIHRDFPLRGAVLADFCQRHRVKRLSFFGSILRDDFRPDSDVDVLVEFNPGQTPSLLTLGGMQQELNSLFGREVDLKTPGFLSPEIRERVRREAEVAYGG